MASRKGRSRYVADAPTQKLYERECRLIRACEATDKSAAVRAVEREFDALEDVIEEPWGRGLSR
jgi:hypothetical protein